MTQIGRVVFEHVRREQNREADRLSNLAMDLAEGRAPVPPPAVEATEAAPSRPLAPREISIPRPSRPSRPAHRHAEPRRFDFADEE